MIGLLLLAAFGHFAAPQATYDCQCGLFAIEQAPGQIGEAAPIPFKAYTTQVSPDVCLEPAAGNNTCKLYCDQWNNDLVTDGWGLCDAQAYDETVGIQRCYGGLYCEALFADGRIPEEGGLTTAIRTWFRIQQCAEASDYQQWNLATTQLPEALCCTSYGVYDSCYQACDCVKADPQRYCECGVFANVQFSVDETLAPLPFRMVSSSVGDTPFSFCDNYIANSPSEECEAKCRDVGTTYLNTYTLNDYAYPEYNVEPNVVTYGQLYCSTLRSRNIINTEGINTELRVFKRAPLCYFPPSEVVWDNMAPQVEHLERLCCHEDGAHEYPCPEP